MSIKKITSPIKVALAFSMAVASIFVVLPAEASDVAGATVSGKVQAKNGTGIARDLVGVPLQIERFDGRSNQAQHVTDLVSTETGYSFSGLQPGTYRVFIAHGLAPVSDLLMSDFEQGPFSLDANGTPYTASPVYRYFKIGLLTTSLAIDLLATSNLEVGTVSGALKGLDGNPLMDGPESARVAARLQFLNAAGDVVTTVSANSAGVFMATLATGEYYARVGCSVDSLIQCRYFGGTATLDASTPITVVANQDTVHIDFEAANLRQFSVLEPITDYSKLHVHLGQTVQAFADAGFTETPKVSFQWYVLNDEELMLGDPGRSIPGATSDTFSVDSNFDSGSQNAQFQNGLIYAEVTYTLEGYSPVVSTLSRDAFSDVRNTGVRAHGYEQPVIVGQPRVTFVTKPKALATLAFPRLKDWDNSQWPYKVPTWYLCDSTKFSVVPANQIHSDQISGGGCKEIPRIGDRSTILPKGYKGKYLIATYWMQNIYYDLFTGVTKPIKLK